MNEAKDPSELYLELLTSALDKQELPFDPHLFEGQGELLQALAHVAKLNKINVTPFPKNLSGDRDIDVEEICAYWSAPIRKISLKGDWYRTLETPLVGFYGPDKRPIVLYWKKGQYHFFFLFSRASYQVQESNLSQIDAAAYQMYPPFQKEQTLNLFDILKFDLQFHPHEVTPIVLMSLVLSLIGLFFPFIVQILFDNVIPQVDSGSLFQIILGLIFASFSTAFLLFVQKFNTSRFLFMVKHDAIIALWNRILRLEPAYFRTVPVGNLFRRFYHVESLQTLISGGALDSIQMAFFFLAYLIFMFYFAPQLAFMALFALSLCGATVYFALRHKLKLQHENLILQEQLTAKIIEFIRGISQIRTTSSEKLIFNLWAQKFALSQALKARIGKADQIGLGALETLPIFVSLLVYLGVIVLLLLHGESGLTLGSFLGFTSALALMTTALVQIGTNLMYTLSVIPALKRAETLLEAPIEKLEGELPLISLKGGISLSQVSFKYPKARSPIFKNLSLEIKPGEFIGIMGKSGSGKSTLIRLLLGFEHPDSGKIFYDGHPLSTLDIVNVRRQFGVVLQNNELLDGSILENLVAGSFATMEDVEKALDMVLLKDFVNTLPMGVHTYVSYGQGTFSSGEIQRLCIARALLNNPKILIFDEATSSLDNQTQFLITEKLDKLGITRIIVAHRPSTLIHAHRIYVLEGSNGADIVAHGTFSELKAQGYMGKII